jgi:23S rRNA (uridine2552-2'-O)-methyltransferase
MSKKSSALWIKRQRKDIYVKLAKQQGLRSRSAYKLLDIVKKTGLIQPGMVVIELGSAPGGWSQIISRLIQPHGKLYCIDQLPMSSLESVVFLQGDFLDPATRDTFINKISDPVDLVLSDIAPNLSGIAIMDQSKTIELATTALMFAQSILKKEGSFLVKLFQGRGFERYLKDLRGMFQKVSIYKPPSSRPESSEVYVIAKSLTDKGTV